MTRNNLANHLAWLLNNIQLSRPIGPTLPAVGQDPFESSRTSSSESSQPVLQSLPQTSHTSSSGSSSNASSSSQQRARPEPIDIDSTLDEDLLACNDVVDQEAENISATAARQVADRLDTDMAKLTTKPTKKPSLFVSRQEQLPTPPTTAASIGKLQQAYTESLSSKNYVPDPTARSLRTPSSPAKKPKRPIQQRNPSPGIAEDYDGELQDLTGAPDAFDPDATSSSAYTFASPIALWNPEAAARPEPTSSRGKKRKSLSPLPPPISQPRTRSKEEDEDEFPDIYDLMDEKESTPDMHQRRKAASSVRDNPPKLHLSASDTTVLKQQTFTQTVSTTQTSIHRTTSIERTPHRSRSQQLSRGVSPSQQRASQGPALARSLKPCSPTIQSSRRRSLSPMNDDFMSDNGLFEPPSPSPKQPRKFKRSDVIMDSESESEASPARHVPQPVLTTTAASNSPLMSSKRKRTPSVGIGQQSSRSANGTSRVGTSPKRRALPASQEAIRCTQPESMVIDYPDEPDRLNNLEPRATRPGSGSDGGTLIMDLFKQQPHVLDVINKNIRDKLAENTELHTRSFREKWPPERRAQVKRERGPLKAQAAAIAKAKFNHETYKQLEVKHEALLTQLTELYDADEDTEELEARLEQVSKEMEDSEQALKKSLTIAGVKEGMFHDLPDPQTLRQSAAASTFQATTPRAPAHLSRENTLIPECASQSRPSSQSLRRQPSVYGESRAASKPSNPVLFDDVSSSRHVGQRNTARTPAAVTAHYDPIDDLIDDEEEMQAYVHASRMSRTRVAPVSARVTSSKRGSSPVRASSRHHDNISDYGDDDDDALVAMAEQVEVHEHRPLPTAHEVTRRARSVLSEASGNTISAARVKAATKKPAKPTAKLKIPAELMKHPWSSDVLRAFKDRFRLEGFRHNQLEAVNATLAGQDAFVLMPTGGGKSLCYQLPAVVHSGKTRGVTIVVTPLISLMQDQVDHLTARGIVAKPFNGDMSRSDKQDILESFKKKNPEHYVQLLYVTPEMISKSQAFLNGLKVLHRNNRLARIVIDEAHCVSQWGHDFRPDYKELGQVRRQFPGVPVMALTATATGNVITDVKHNLDMVNCTVFSQSFNRPNLYYEVRVKERQCVQTIAQLINEKYPNQSGIVYTLSRKSTEQISQKLNDQGISATHYHASMDKDKRIEVQRAWQAGRIKVVVATIAFGMGIDKPDVRFVIHQHLPKTLEGYYQETGRAGRDGLHSDCYLFFSHGDIYQLRKFIDDSDGNRNQKERQKILLNRVVMFCENKRDCRRAQLLHYFGESFSKEDCGQTCDNCKIGGTYETQDRTAYAKAVLEAVMYYSRLTMVQCTDYLRGTKKPTADEEPQPFHGMAKKLSKHEVNGVITSLLMEHALGEENKIGGGGIAIQYFILGQNASKFLNGDAKLQVVVRTGGDKNATATKTKKTATKKKTSVETEVSRLTSTYLSSPIGRVRKGKSIASFIDGEALAEDDEDDDDDLDPRIARHANGYIKDDFVVADDDEDDDYFDPPMAPPPRQRRQRTIDEQLVPTSTAPTATSDGELHDFAISAFVDEAKRLEEETRNNKGLRRPLFTEAQMQQMAIRWTDSLDKMERIPGIDKDKVDRYGVRFLPLVKKYQANYREMMGQQEDALMTIPATAGPASSRHVPPQQPLNDFIDLISDDEDDATYEEASVSSKYFRGAPAPDLNDPLTSQLDNWERRMEAVSNVDDFGAETGRRASSKKGSRGGGKRSYYRGGSKGGGSKSSYSGVSKRKGSSTASTRGGGNRRSSAGSARSGTSKGTSRGSGHGNGGGSGIGLMPF